MSNPHSRRQPRPSIAKESGLLQRARQFLRERFPGTTPHFVVGYSGGQDSLALLLVLRELERLGACRVTAAHVDHGLRPDSTEAAERAMAVLAELGVPAVLKTAEGSLRRAYPGQSVEDIARRFRYQQLTRVLEEVGADAIAVAHHRRDQAETVLLHLMRGAGLAGLRGMVADHLLAVTWFQKPGYGPATMVRVVRPFLREAPEEIAAVAERSGLPIIEDGTNASLEFRRNRIRHELLPLMEEIAPGATGRIVSLAEIVHEDEVAFNEVSMMFLARSMDDEALMWEALQGAPKGLQRRVVRGWIEGIAQVDELSRERVDAVIELARRNEGGKRVELGDGWLVRFARGRLEVVRPGRR
jgi:tRNA(Ile)-lysidine synthase